MRKKVVRLGIVAAAILAGTYGVISYRYWNNPPNLSRNFSAEWNAPILAVPENERAWPAYRQALLDLSNERPDGYRESTHWKEPFVFADEQPYIAFVRRNAGVLANVRAASRRPTFGFLMTDGRSSEDAKLETRRRRMTDPQRKESEPIPATENPLLDSLYLVDFTEMSELVDLLAIDACLAAREGDGDRMTENLTSIMRIADHVREISHPIHDITSVGLFDRGLRTWGRLLETSATTFDERRSIELERAARAYAKGSIRLRVDYDRARMEDALQRAYTDDGEGDGYLTALSLVRGDGNKIGVRERLLAPLTTGLDPSRREIREAHEHLTRLAEQDVSRPLWECRTWSYETELERLHRNKRFHIISLMASTYESAHKSFEKIVQHRDAMLAFSAMHRFRLKRGTWPKSLGELVPEFAAEVPVDRLTGGRLGYKLAGDRPLVYSFGSDGDDDGGRAARLPKEGSHVSDPLPERPWHWDLDERESGLEGDLILWPVISAEDLEHMARRRPPSDVQP
jgi:hypothetical protein